jgi:hypothetical protein
MTCWLCLAPAQSDIAVSTSGVSVAELVRLLDERRFPTSSWLDFTSLPLISRLQYSAARSKLSLASLVGELKPCCDGGFEDRLRNSWRAASRCSRVLEIISIYNATSCSWHDQPALSIRHLAALQPPTVAGFFSTYRGAQHNSAAPTGR